MSQLPFQKEDACFGPLPGREVRGGTNRPGDREILNETDDFRVGFPQQSWTIRDEFLQNIFIDSGDR